MADVEAKRTDFTSYWSTMSALGDASRYVLKRAGLFSECEAIVGISYKIGPLKMTGRGYEPMRKR